MSVIDKPAPPRAREQHGLGCNGLPPTGPHALWWGGRTEIDTGEGKFYLAKVHDAFSGRALGYAMGER
ncbi:hypothetical protein [Streptomyces sp. NPDC000994]